MLALPVFQEGARWVDPGKVGILFIGHLGSRSHGLQAGEFGKASEKRGGKVWGEATWMTF